MAKSIGIIGGFTGRLGNSVGYYRRGQQLLRVYQPNVTNPNTHRQQVTRNMFVIATDLTKSFGLVPYISMNKINPTFERQVFAGSLIKQKVISVNNQGDVNVAWADMQISAGPLTAPSTSSAVFEAGTIAVPYEAPAQQDFLVDGVTPMKLLVFLAVHNPSRGETVVNVGQVLNAYDENVTRRATINVPSSWTGDGVHVWMFFKQSPDPLNDVPIQQIPTRIRFNGSPSTYVGFGTVV